MTEVHNVDATLRALLADVLAVGARYREVVVFHSELLYPEYVIAYQRFEGGNGPL